MLICGLNKTTLLDYPGHVAATVFLGGCNFRCPFCQNSSLVLHPEKEQLYSPEEILRFLEKRRSVLTGVCITGGEPTLQKDLADFLRDIHALGYLIKLDTNGSMASSLQELLESKVLDYIAMDIKSDLAHYGDAIGISNPAQLASIQENIAASVSLIMSSSIPYEFRTTVVKELHTEETFSSIGKWIHGAEQYFLQNYEDSGQILMPGYHAAAREDLDRYLSIIKPLVKLASLRGVD